MEKKTTVLDASLILAEPIALSYPKAGMTPRLRRALVVGPALMVLGSLLLFGWHGLGLPTFTVHGHEYGWIFVPVAALIYGAVRMISQALVEERAQRSRISNWMLADQLSKEVIPFIEEQVARVETGSPHGSSIPPLDWLSAALMEDARRGTMRAGWNEQIWKTDRTDRFTNFSAFLEDGGRRIRVVAQQPDGV